MTTMHTGPLAGIGLTLPADFVHNAVLMVLVVLAVWYALLLWAIHRSAHDGGAS
jgi:hypothetical protein